MTASFSDAVNISRRQQFKFLVEFVRFRSREGLTGNDATRMATRERFRAIVLTSFTTVPRIAPPLSETSLQAQILISLVTSIALAS